MKNMNNNELMMLNGGATATRILKDIFKPKPTNPSPGPTFPEPIKPRLSLKF